jgi:hypothetical protein
VKKLVTVLLILALVGSFAFAAGRGEVAAKSAKYEIALVGTLKK